ncbi:F-box only protein 28-like [Artemia franciscana]|uniref:F-box domain-containing protein n=1 Tax=Artemia franciscana TaxID=6661 RepID=A0AA88KX04_ARTSF|nr:hypothetical protein QYM36_015015 [Artemia franciscana]KAK2707187.1 hypothetical protein QYM36_015015 [Artemia franciscana]
MATIPPNICDLPDVCIEVILGYLNYEEISKVRLVCHHFNEVSQGILNRGFSNVQKCVTRCIKVIKSQLPKRDSQRRSHHLAKHMDILSSLETRISLLSMTYVKYIEIGVSCFIPGKVLDELYSVIRYVMLCGTAPKNTGEVLQELRDISSMAMEHFDEKVAPFLKKRETSTFQLGGGDSGTTNEFIELYSDVVEGRNRLGMMEMMLSLQKYKYGVHLLRNQIGEHQKKFLELEKRALEQEKKFLIQEKKILEQAKKSIEQEKLLFELSRQVASLMDLAEPTGTKRKAEDSHSGASKMLKFGKISCFTDLKRVEIKGDELSFDGPSTSYSVSVEVPRSNDICCGAKTIEDELLRMNPSKKGDSHNLKGKNKRGGTKPLQIPKRFTRSQSKAH